MESNAGWNRAVAYSLMLQEIPAKMAKVYPLWFGTGMLFTRILSRQLEWICGLEREADQIEYFEQRLAYCGGGLSAGGDSGICWRRGQRADAIDGTFDDALQQAGHEEEGCSRREEYGQEGKFLHRQQIELRQEEAGCQGSYQPSRARGCRTEAYAAEHPAQERLHRFHATAANGSAVGCHTFCASIQWRVELCAESSRRSCFGCISGDGTCVHAGSSHL